MLAELQAFLYYFDCVGSQLMIEMTLLNGVAQVGDIIGRWPTVPDSLPAWHSHLQSFATPLAIRMITVFGVFDKYVVSCEQAALWMVFSVRLSHLFHYVPIIASSWNFHELLPMTRVRSLQKVKVKGQGHRGQNPALPFPDRNSSTNSQMIWCTKLGVA